MVAVGFGLWSPRPQSQALLLAPFRPQTSRAVEREHRVRTEPRRQGQGRARVALRALEQVVPGPDHQLPGLPSLQPQPPRAKRFSSCSFLDDPGPAPP